MIVVTFKPDVSKTFHRMKTYMDEYTYNIRESAYPHLDSFTVSGSGFGATDIVGITVNDSPMTKMGVASDGTFSYEIGRSDSSSAEGMKYDQSNSVTVSRSTDGGTTFTTVWYKAIDTYYWAVILNLFAMQYVKSLQSIGQSKQDIYIYPFVGDESQTIAERVLETEVDSYSSSWSSLRDKLTLPIPGDIWSKDREDSVQKSIEISSYGPVVYILELLKEIYAPVGVTDLFMQPQDSQCFWDLKSVCVPRITENTLIFPAGTRCRYEYGIMSITPETAAEEIPITVPVSGDPVSFEWYYVDGDMDVDGTLQIKHSETQPLPGYMLTSGVAYSVSGTPTLVYTDTDATVTGILNQKYLVLHHPLYTVSGTIAVYDAMDGSDSKKKLGAQIISRNIVALGVGTISNKAGDLDAVYYEYYRYYEPKHLCCLRKAWVNGTTLPEPGPSGPVYKLLRLWNLPGHVRSTTPIVHMGADIFIRTSTDISASKYVLESIRDVMKQVLPVWTSYQYFISLGNKDQTNFDEDTIYWSTQFKGFQSVRTLV
jgi:hypothetical protein